jgi:hypothetical protein
MKILRITVIIILLFSPAEAFTDEVDSNSALHFGFSMVFGIMSETFLHYNVDMSAPPRIFYATVISSIPGLAKEVMDSSEDKGNFSSYDMAFNVTGALTGSLISNYMNDKFLVSMSSKQDGAILKLSFNY